MPAGAADLTAHIAPPFRAPANATFQPMRTEPQAAPLCIAWRIGLPTRVQAAAELRWTIHDGRASAALHTAGAQAQQPLAEARLTRRIHDAPAGLEHLEVEGLLWLTLRHAGDGPPTLLFARTTLFTRLDIPGGRYAAPLLL